MIDLFEQLKYYEIEIANKEAILPVKAEELFKKASFEHQKEIEEMFLDDTKTFEEVGRLATEKLKIKLKNYLAELAIAKKEIANLKVEFEKLKQQIIKLSIIPVVDFTKLIKLFIPDIQILTTKKGTFLCLDNKKIAKLNNGNRVVLIYNNLELNTILIKLNIFIMDFVKLYINRRFVDNTISVIDFYREYREQEQLKNSCQDIRFVIK